MKKIYNLALFSISIFLTACTPNIEDAKKLGFESLEQMAAFQARGYNSMNDYRSVKELTPDYFYKNCSKAMPEFYNNNCKNKKISWSGIVENINSSAIRIVVLDNNLQPLEGGLTIDSKSLKEKISESDLKKIIEFDGTIDAKNFMYPDIEKAYIVKIESDIEKNIRIERVAKEKKEQERQEFEENGMDSAWLDKKYGTSGAIWCGYGADDYLRETAKYSFKWDKIGFLGVKFDSYLKRVNSPGVITYVSDKASLQNGFGAFVRIELFCDYDTQIYKVLRYDFRQ